MGSVLGGYGLSVGVPVPPVDHGGEAFIMYGIGHGGTDTRPLHALIMVECSPFRALVNEILVYDQAAIGADQFRSLIVADEGMAPALWAFDGKLLKFINLFFLAFEPGPLF